MSNFHMWNYTVLQICNEYASVNNSKNIPRLKSLTLLNLMLISVLHSVFI